MTKYLFDDNLRVEGRIDVGGGVTLYFQTDCGMYCEGSFSSNGFSDNGTVIKGVNGTSWRGMAISERASFRNSTIEGSGSGVVEVGGLTAEAPAAIYTTAQRGAISNVTFSSNTGYGVYYADSTAACDIDVDNTVFLDQSLAAIRTTPQSVGEMLSDREDRANEYNMPDGIPAILVQTVGFPTRTWPDLGDDNFYLIDAQMITNRYVLGWRLMAGAHIKFKDGTYGGYQIDLNNAALSFRVNGTADKPVIFDSESGTPGSWGGFYLGTKSNVWWEIEHLIVRNGGGFLIPGTSTLPDATEKANNLSFAHASPRVES